MAFGIFILTLCLSAAGFSAWRIWRLARLKPPPPESESIKVITDRFERDMEEIFRNWR